MASLIERRDPATSPRRGTQPIRQKTWLQPSACYDGSASTATIKEIGHGARTGDAAAIVAHHEAGHAVIAHMLGCRVERVSIDEDSGATLIKWSGRGEQRIERQILSTLAGPYSQRRFAPRSHWRSRSHAGFASGYDFDNVTGLIHDLHGNGKVAERYWAYMEARAEALVDQHWLHIEGMVKVLLKHGTVTGDICTVFPPPGSVVTGKRP